MSITFRSNHFAGAASTGSLDVAITIEDDRRGQTINDRISFEVPRDFHTHGDSVAAALMTLVGSRSPTIRFNFPISEDCASRLRDYYNLTDVGPISPSIEPRQRGTSLGLMFSGGMDSLAIWMLLTSVLGEDGFKVVTTDFGGDYTFERRGFAYVPRHVTCRTDFRIKRYDRSGRFTGAVALLFADYLDLDSVITGHLIDHPPLSVESLIDGRAPRYLLEDRPFLAGGLGEIHLARALCPVSPLWIAMQGNPEYLEAGWRGSSTPGALKSFKKGLMLGYLFDRAGMRRPKWLENLLPVRRPWRLLDNPATLLSQLYMFNRIGTAPYRPHISDLSLHDVKLVEHMDLTFAERYNPNITSRLPEFLQGPVLSSLHNWGILPYTERDWIEFSYVGKLCDLALSGGKLLGQRPSGEPIEPFCWPYTESRAGDSELFGG